MTTIDAATCLHRETDMGHGRAGTFQSKPSQRSPNGKQRRSCNDMRVLEQDEMRFD
jgi:hypothetical protein